MHDEFWSDQSITDTRPDNIYHTCTSGENKTIMEEEQ